METDADGPRQIRLARVADAAALAAVHIRAWQWAYRGQMPDAFLDGLADDLQRRTAWRRSLLERDETEHRTWVAEWEGRIVGFADTVPSREPEGSPGTAELLTIYLDDAATGRGIGRALLSRALDDLRQRGFRAATLWVLTTNERARRFYAAAGWRPDGATRIEHGPGFELHELRYAIDLATARPVTPTGEAG